MHLLMTMFSSWITDLPCPICFMLLRVRYDSPKDYVEWVTVKSTSVENLKGFMVMKLVFMAMM